MAALIIALFPIVVVWGWFLIPKKGGAHKAATFSMGGQPKTNGRKSRSKQDEVTVVPVTNTGFGHGAPVPVVGGHRTGASARRRRVRTVLVGAAVGSLVLALYAASVNWWLTHAAFDALLLIYYGLEMQLQDGSVRGAATPTSTEQATQPALRRVVGG
jgi:hypothetical protein